MARGAGRGHDQATMRLRIAATSLTLLFAVGLTAIAPAAAASTTLYVDGKTGNDANDGHSSTSAFRTIAKAAMSIPKGSAPGWSVVVKGYTDYIYRERAIPWSYASSGSSSAPIVFKAAGYVAGSGGTYVRPIVSGADTAPRPGQSWSSSSRPGVYWTSWTEEPFWYGELTWTIKTAIFQNKTTWLWEQSSLTALADRAKSGLGGFWWDSAAKRLYVSAVGAPGSGTNPAGKSIEVIERPTFYFQGVAHIEVRGFEVRHAANGIGFVKGTDYSVAADNFLIGNHMMGIQTAGVQTPSGPNPAVGNVIVRNTATYNTLQFAKIDIGSQDTTVCDNSAANNALRGILVQGPPPGSTYTGATTDVTVCRNKLFDHDFNPTGTPYNNASGITVANGARNVTIDRNRIWGNDVGIHISQEGTGRQLLTGIISKYNEVWGNHRYGLQLYDGAFGNGTGTVTVSHDVYWGNGTGIMVSSGSSNKVISATTIHHNAADGIRVGVSGQASSSVTVSKSLITSNGTFGLALVAGNSAALMYVGLPGNVKGPIAGSPTTSATNTKPAVYLSEASGSGDFLRIGSSSFQYTAGPGGTPIGARY
jgi:hypothetical protein